MDRGVVAREIVDGALQVHSSPGPGLLESPCEACLAYEPSRRGRGVRRQVLLPVRYGAVEIDAGYRIDLLVDGQVVVEVKAVANMLPIHQAQLLSHLLSYLRLGQFRLGLLLNFHVARMKQGIRRVLSGYGPWCPLW